LRSGADLSDKEKAMVKADRLLRLLLALLVIASGSLLLNNIVSSRAQAASSGRQTWEYKIIVEQRGFAAAPDVSNPSVHYATDWSSWYENGKAIPLPVDFPTKLNALGTQGWELVSVTARSNISGYYAGTTTDQIWVLKRLKT
jgi:hypothetical protein